jgi:hypothetical protein
MATLPRWSRRIGWSIVRRIVRRRRRQGVEARINGMVDRRTTREVKLVLNEIIPEEKGH